MIKLPEQCVNERIMVEQGTGAGPQDVVQLEIKIRAN